MAKYLSIALSDGSTVTLADADWTTLVSAGLNGDQMLRVLKHGDETRVVVYGQAGGCIQGEAVPLPTARENLEGCLRRVCERLDLPLDLVHSCLRRLPAKL